MLAFGAVADLAIADIPTSGGVAPTVKVIAASLLNRKTIMAQRGVAMTVEFLAWDTSANAPKTGDAANITLRWVKDGTSAALTTTTVTEVDSTNCPGLYKCDLSSTETDCKMGMLHGHSSTGSVYLMPVEIGFVYTPTAAITVTGGTIKVDVDTIKTNPVVNAGTITFPTNATLASTTNITAGTITTVTTVTNQLTAAQIATGVWQDATAGDFTAVGSIGKSIMNGVALGTGLTVNDITTKTGFSLSGAQTFNLTGNITGNVSGSVGSVTARVTANTDQLAGQTVTAAAGVTFPATVSSYAGADTAGTTTLLSRLSAGRATLLDNLDQTTGGVILTSAGATAAADALLGRNVSGGSSAGRTVKQALHFIRNKWVVSGGSLTVYDTDDTTTSWTAAVTGTAGADPITANDPT